MSVRLELSVFHRFFYDLIILRRLGGHGYTTSTCQKKLMQVTKDVLSGVFAVADW